MNKTGLALSVVMFAAAAVSPVLAFDPASVNGADYDEKSAAKNRSSQAPEYA
jgi:hypothetical protein